MNVSSRKLLIENNNHIEQNVLSIILNDNDSILEIIEYLDVDDFLNQQNRLIYREITDMFRDNIKLDITLLINRLASNKDMFNEEPHVVILKIVNLYTNSSQLENYLKIIKSNSVAYKVNLFGSKLSDYTFNFDKLDDELWNLQKEFQDIINLSSKSNLITSVDLSKNYTKLLEVIRNRGEQLTGTSSGFSDIDEFTNGFQEGDLIILAARPSIGKTALALNFLINAAKDAKENECVVMFSLEMSANQLMERIVSSETGVNSRLLKNGSWNKNDDYLIDDCIERIERLPIIIDESSNASILDIQSKLKKISISKKIKLVVVDYLQLVQGSTKLGINRQQEVAQISRALKSLARDLKTPIIAVAQLSRKIEERKGSDKKPILSDLRESGSIEQDADLVTFLDYDRSNVDESNSNNVIKKYESIVVVDFIIAKHRNGATGEIKLAFDKSCGKYSSYKNN